jgi:ubiquitin carboxyl-terminal hydrolase 7
MQLHENYREQHVDDVLMRQPRELSLTPTAIEKEGSSILIISRQSFHVALCYSFSYDDATAPRENPYMPNCDNEVEAYGEYHWTVENFEQLRQAAEQDPNQRKAYSPRFKVGDDHWLVHHSDIYLAYFDDRRIMIFPNGNNTPEFLSMFLEYPDIQERPPSWYKCVQFSLRLSNVEDGTIEHYRGMFTPCLNETLMILVDTNHRFNHVEPDWGFTQFVRIPSLRMPENGAARPIMENEKIVLSVYIRIVKDPIGTLWHKFDNWDSKMETGFVGLRNQGATCYMNSLLQSLYFTNYFRRAVYQIPTEDDIPTKSVSLALQRVFYLLQHDNHAVGTFIVTRLLYHLR